MSVIQQIRNDLENARRNADTDKVGKLAALLGEATAIGKNKGNRETTDEETIAVAAKFVKNLEDTLALAAFQTTDAENLERSKKILEEIDMYKAYMPMQLGADELRGVISGIFEQIPEAQRKGAMGLIMKVLKANYAGQYDGKMASDMAREIVG